MRLPPDKIETIKQLGKALQDWSGQKSHPPSIPSSAKDGWYGSLIPVLTGSDSVKTPTSKRPPAIYEEVLDCLDSFDFELAERVKKQIEILQERAHEVDNGQREPIVVRNYAAKIAKELETIANGGQASGDKITKEEANIQARKLIKENPSITARQLVKKIPCSLGLVSQLPAWKALQEYKKKTFGGKKPKMIPLTKELEYILGTKDEQLNQLIVEQAEGDKEKPRLYIRKHT